MLETKLKKGKIRPQNGGRQEKEESSVAWKLLLHRRRENVKAMHSYILYSRLRRQKGPQPTPFPHKCLYTRREAQRLHMLEKGMTRKLSILNAPLD
jgi:hypothetical protein